jgi:hypothetical protein
MLVSTEEKEFIFQLSNYELSLVEKVDFMIQKLLA